MTTHFVAPDTRRQRHTLEQAWLPATVPDTRAARDLTTRFTARDAEPAERDESSPRVDDDDLLWRGNTWCALAPIEATIIRTLIECRPRVVSREELIARVWPDGAPKGRPVDGRLHRLRARLEPLGMHIHSIRRRGLMLGVDPPGGPAAQR